MRSANMLLTLTTALGLATLAAAQRGTVVRSGVGCGISPGLATAGLPDIGTNMSISALLLPSDTIAATLLFAASSTNVPLTTLGAPGCSLYVDSIWLAQPMSISSRVGTVGLYVANDPGSIGLTAHVQAVALSPSTNALGVAFSNQATLTVGQAPPPSEVIVRVSGTLQTATGTPFTIENTAASTANITRVEFDILDSTGGHTATTSLDADEGLGSRSFLVGNATVGCPLTNTYSGSDTTTGLIYPNTLPAEIICRLLDPFATTGWNPTRFDQFLGTIWAWQFGFNGFAPGETFRFAADVDGPMSTDGADLAGVEVTVTMSDGRVLTGHLAATSAQTSEVRF